MVIILYALARYTRLIESIVKEGKLFDIPEHQAIFKVCTCEFLIHCNLLACSLQCAGIIVELKSTMKQLDANILIYRLSHTTSFDEQYT